MTKLDDILTQLKELKLFEVVELIDMIEEAYDGSRYVRKRR